jgi:hypothetical protein
MFNSKNIKMKTNLNSVLAGMMISLLLIAPSAVKGQSDKAFVKKYLTELPKVKLSNERAKYRMTAVYVNRDLYGKFTGKKQVTGEYTRGLPGDSVVWNNTYISDAQKYEDSFPAGSRKEYMENFKYIPSDAMLEEKAFKGFPSNPENVFVRNLVWDMYSFEIFAWKDYDSLKLNVPYDMAKMSFKFDMAEIGNYQHNGIILCWKGITVINGEMCAVIEFDAIDNIIELTMASIKAKGTEQYWGTVFVSLKTKLIERATMGSGTILEIEVPGMKDKFLTKTIRELEVEKIQ